MLAGLSPRWRRALLLTACLGTLLVTFNYLFGIDAATGWDIGRSYFNTASNNHYNKKPYRLDSAHPISGLIREANTLWHRYESDRSLNFRETVTKYRQQHGRHPPPGFKEWYIFARERGIHNVDDFKQIMDDLRPFWAVSPKDLRKMAAKLQKSDNIASIHVRHHEVARVTKSGWRIETLSKMVGRLAKYLPDMDIAMNLLDQPRVIVPHEDMKQLLEVELKSRTLALKTKDEYTTAMDHFLDLNDTSHVDEKTDPEWFSPPIEEFVDGVIKAACPPDSPLGNSSMSIADADQLYKTPLGGFSTNFTLSTDLCAVGPAIKDKHGFLFTPSSLVITKRLVPVFSECKVSVNNDILFPANMYMLQDERYIYNGDADVDWEQKKNSLLWRGVTSGGAALEGHWRRMHRQRLVLYTNSTELKNERVSILSETPLGRYETFRQFQPSDFAEHYFDIGFTEAWGCIPNCDFYNGFLSYKKSVSMKDQFKTKYLVDVDGHSFSGRWRAFHLSKSLGIKATIFREWHDSRLFAWRHFIPLDNRYDDLYSIMTYLIGTGDPPERMAPPPVPGKGATPVSGGKQQQQQQTDKHDKSQARSPNTAYIRDHDVEAKMIATQSRHWAQLVLRDEDLEIYMLRLLLEYARLIDDNRDKIGYSGDGSELDEFDVKNPMPPVPSDYTI